MKLRYVHSRGYTVVELLTVVVVIGLLAALSAPTMPRMYENMKVRQAAHTIKRQLISAKVRALSDPYLHVGVHFTTTSTPPETFIFFDRPAGAAYAWNSGTDDLYLGKFILPRGLTMTLSNVTNSCIVFRGDGSAKTGGTIELQTRYGQTRRINVLASTGRVKVTIP